MKTKIFAHSLKSLPVLFCLLLIGEVGWAQTTIVGFTLAVNNAATSGTSSNSGSVVTETASGSPAYTSTDGAAVSGWDNGAGTKYWQTSFSTLNFHSLYISYQQRSVSVGPKNFRLYYSLDGTTFIAISDQYNLVGNFTGENFNYNNSGYSSIWPDMNNRPIVYLRIMMTTNAAANNGNTQSGGNSFLKGMSISGTLLAAPSEQSSQLSIVATDDTHILLSFTPGVASGRIIKMNTTSSFTNPSDNTSYSSQVNTIYQGSGEQVVAAGDIPEVTVE
ncbi:MAG: hypothetical protein WCI71_19215, partial [Bacteroidota bacterium]